jgi:hypothetical protein
MPWNYGRKVLHTLLFLSLAARGYSEYRPCAHSPFPSLAVTLYTEPQRARGDWPEPTVTVPKCDSESPKLVRLRLGVNLVRLFHEDVTFKVDLQDDGNTIIIINYTIVKQGDELAPVLFLCYIQAALETSFQKFGSYFKSCREYGTGTYSVRLQNGRPSAHSPPGVGRRGKEKRVREGRGAPPAGGRCLLRVWSVASRPSGAWSVDP